MYFSPTKNKTEHEEPEPKVYIGKTKIKRVKSTKFLGIVLDEDLNFTPHIKQLAKKLASCTGSINRIMKSVPERLHRDLYHTLFESHLTYGISVWGGIPKTKLEPLFIAQKKIMRVLFGDRDAYLDKFKTCARTRTYGSQILGEEFFSKEHSKPLFIENEVLALNNLYFYHTANEAYKIFKFQSPTVLFKDFNFSRREAKSLFAITPQPTSMYTYRASVIWNLTRNITGITSTVTKPSTVKSKVKQYLLSIQKLGDEHWIEHNFV